MFGWVRKILVFFGVLAPPEKDIWWEEWVSPVSQATRIAQAAQALEDTPPPTNFKAKSTLSLVTRHDTFSTYEIIFNVCIRDQMPKFTNKGTLLNGMSPRMIKKYFDNLKNAYHFPNPAHQMESVVISGIINDSCPGRILAGHVAEEDFVRIKDFAGVPGLPQSMLKLRPGILDSEQLAARLVRWDFPGLSMNTSLTGDIVASRMDADWDANKLAKNSGIDPQFTRERESLYISELFQRLPTLTVREIILALTDFQEPSMALVDVAEQLVVDKVARHRVMSVIMLKSGDWTFADAARIPGGVQIPDPVYMVKNLPHFWKQDRENVWVFLVSIGMNIPEDMFRDVFRFMDPGSALGVGHRRVWPWGLPR